MGASLGSQRSQEVTTYPRLSASYRPFLAIAHLRRTSRSHIIHTVGPVYSSREKEEKAELLESSYKTSLEVAVENGIRHLVRRFSIFIRSFLRHFALPGVPFDFHWDILIPDC
jgi:hypothetical protein